MSALAAAEEGRVILKYKEDSALAQQRPVARARALAVLPQANITRARSISRHIDVITAAGISSEQLAAQLTAHDGVAYAVPDRRKFARAMPNDPLYSGQWYLQSSQTAAIKADTAWDITTGSPSIVIAVLDTGVRPDHPDLVGKLLTRSDGSVYGYDFISDARIANDGNGRDGDPSDPGDFITSADLAAHPDLFGPCGVVDSSWHGTEVTGIAGAASNNSVGVAGVSWGSPILSLRVLGKCGGYDSDIIAAMRWAAGLSVDGVPANTSPAKVLNLSLGGGTGCSAAYRDVIAEINAAGATIVVSAGNESGAVDEPGNCPGVLSVAGIRHNGVKVGYSSYGPEVDVAAPAGNCVNTTGSCLFPIVTTSNNGTTTPGGHIYTDDTNAAVGTSFAAPQAAGVAALMLSVNSALPASQIIARIQQAATPFPFDASVPSCEVGVAPVTAQCNCTTATCGAGMLNAASAVGHALRPFAHIAPVSSAVPGALVSLVGSGSTASNGRSIVSYQWTITAGNGVVSSISNATQAVTSILPATAGSFTVSLSVTDNAGASDTTSSTITVTDPTPAPSSSGGGGGGGGSLDLYTLIAMLCLSLAAQLTGVRRSRRHIHIAAKLNMPAK